MVSIPALTRLITRNKDKLNEMGINGPFEVGDGRWLFTDCYAAVVVEPYEELAQWAVAEEWSIPTYLDKYDKMMAGFTARAKTDVAVFKTTTAAFSAWLQLGTEECPKCGGISLCEIPSTSTKRPPAAGQADSVHWSARAVRGAMSAACRARSSPEDVLSAHYGWVGPAAVDRRRLQELLECLHMPPEHVIKVSGFHRPRTNTKDHYFGVRIDCGKDGPAAFLAGLTDIQEDATKFHTDGQYLDLKLRHAK